MVKWSRLTVCSNVSRCCTTNGTTSPSPLPLSPSEGERGRGSPLPLSPSEGERGRGEGAGSGEAETPVVLGDLVRLRRVEQLPLAAAARVVEIDASGPASDLLLK